MYVCAGLYARGMVRICLTRGRQERATVATFFAIFCRCVLRRTVRGWHPAHTLQIFVALRR
jgi:hypothetical protein